MMDAGRDALDLDDDQQTNQRERRSDAEKTGDRSKKAMCLICNDLRA
jgi:hypothetical protein